MTLLDNPPQSPRRSGERGGARLKLLVIIFLITVAGYAAYQYLPVALKATAYKDFMQKTVNVATASTPAQSTEWVKTQLRAGGEEYGLPSDATVEAQQRDGRMEAHVSFTRDIPLPGYVYKYSFDHTVKSSAFMSR